MFFNEQETKRIKQFFRHLWSSSFWAVLALLLGVLLGVLFATDRIVNDCKYSGAFRVDSQAFNCQRRI